MCKQIIFRVTPGMYDIAWLEETISRLKSKVIMKKSKRNCFPIYIREETPALQRDQQETSK